LIVLGIGNTIIGSDGERSRATLEKSKDSFETGKDGSFGRRPLLGPNTQTRIAQTIGRSHIRKIPLISTEGLIISKRSIKRVHKIKAKTSRYNGIKQVDTLELEYQLELE